MLGNVGKEAAKYANRALGKKVVGAIEDTAKYVGRQAGDALLSSLLINRMEKGPDGKERAARNPSVGDKDFREQMREMREDAEREGGDGKYTRDFEGNPFMGTAAKNPEIAARAAQFGAPLALFGGMAAAGTALGGMFEGKPSSEYKVPVQPKSYQSITSATAGGGGFGPYNNANIAASNAATANTAYLETLKHKHNLDIIAAKAQAREPGVQDIGGTSMPTPTPRSAAEAYASAVQKPSAMNEELMSFARMLYGTGLKL